MFTFCHFYDPNLGEQFHSHAESFYFQTFMRTTFYRTHPSWPLARFYVYVTGINAPLRDKIRMLVAALKKKKKKRFRDPAITFETFDCSFSVKKIQSVIVTREILSPEN